MLDLQDLTALPEVVKEIEIEVDILLFEDRHYVASPNGGTECVFDILAKASL